MDTIGQILHPRPTLVAGVELDLGDGEYWLRRCRKCGFQFKDPPIDQDRLLKCYESATSDNWEIDPDPWLRQFDMLKSVVKKYAAGSRILDIGCFNGAMLSYFGDSWQAFGIEPSQAAGSLAEKRGVRLLGPSLEHVDPKVDPFDVILAIDVVEHIIDPLPFFQRVSDLLAPNGIFVVLTGDTRSLSWRLQGSHYWYVSLPEHVSFYSQATLDWIGQRVKMAGIDYRRLSHRRLSTPRWISDSLKSAAYIVGRGAGGFGIPALRRQFVERRGPSVESARDHLMYVYRKP
jgi:SAM-dependent methyltransferase